MKKKKLFLLLPLIAFVAYVSLTSSSGGIANVHSAALGGCSCHGAQNTSTLITLSGLPINGYQLGVTYSLTLNVTNTSITPSSPFGLRDGFDIKASAGSFAVAPGTQNGSSTSELLHNTPKAPVAGTASWTFNWTAPSTGTAAITFNAACNATNGNGSAGAPDAWNFFVTTLTKNPVDPFLVTTTATAITCNGGSSTITATGANGSLPYQYQLNTGLFQSSGVFSGNPAGIYTITVKDGLNATASTIRNITQPSAIVFAAGTTTNPLCNGGTGSLIRPASGGTGTTKTYSITPLGPQTNTTGSFTGLTPQSYTITVSDANSCTKTTVATVTSPALLNFTTTVSNPACNGGTGSVTSPASGGTGTKSYSITPLGPQTNSTGSFTGLTAQNYTISVIDGNSCTRTTAITITSPAALTFLPPSVSPPLCNNGLGGFTIAASGGTIGKVYSIVPGGMSSTNGLFINLTAQTYTATVTDGAGCTKTTIVNIPQPSPITFSASTITNPLCNGGTGVATVNASGGTGALTYSWSNASTGATLFEASKDNTIFEQNQNNSNGAGPYIFAGQLANTFRNRALLKFNLSSLPAGAVVTTCTLTLNCSNSAPGSGAQPINLHKLTQDWGEGTSNSGSPGGTGVVATPNDATWLNRFHPSTAWTTAGGSFNPTISGSTLVDAIGYYFWSSVGMSNDVQSWLSNGSTNFGWLLKGQETANTQAKRFDSRENSSLENRPTLDITYNLGTVATQGDLLAGTYTVTATDINGCTQTTLVTITEPSPTLVTANNVTGCIGSPVNLIGSPAGGVFSESNPYTGPSTTYTYTYTDGNGCSTTSLPASITMNPCSNTTLNLTCFIQGYWDGVSGMVPVLANSSQTTTPNACDSIDVFLKDANPPYATVASTKAVLNTNGTCTAQFAGSFTGSYYIAIEHRSAICTWSANPVSMAGSPSYNFTTANSQSYGPNMVEVTTGVWAFLSGDVAKDASESINIDDIAQVELDNANFVFGYTPTDIDGGGDVNLTDFPLVELNINSFIFCNRP